MNSNKPLTGFVIKYPECIMDEVEPTIKILVGQVDISLLYLEDITDHIAADFIVIPGGSCDEATKNKNLRRLIRNVKSNKGLLAGICNGAMVLAS